MIPGQEVECEGQGAGRQPATAQQEPEVAIKEVIILVVVEVPWVFMVRELCRKKMFREKMIYTFYFL